MHAELLADLVAQGFRVGPGSIGENITTRGLDLLGLPTGALLSFPSGAAVEVTGLRNPCAQLDAFQQGLTEALLRRHPDGQLERLAGIMGIVVVSGPILPSDSIAVTLPSEPHRALDKV